MVEALIRLRLRDACGAAVAAVCSFTALAADGPTVYSACGIGTVGAPTRAQLLCVAEAIGVPAEPTRRVVRRGFDKIFAEPVLEVLHQLSRRRPDGAPIVWTLKLELSELDGQILFYGLAREPMPDDPPRSEDAATTDPGGSAQRRAAPADLCPVDAGSQLSPERLRCMARALGIGDGLDGLRVFEDPHTMMGSCWTVRNLVELGPCNSWGMAVDIAQADARIVHFGLIEGHCGEGPEPKRPILRTGPR